MGYQKNEIVTAEVLRIKDNRLNLLLPDGQTTTITSEDFCEVQGVSLKNRVKVGDKLKVEVQGYSEDGKPMVSHKRLLGNFWDNLALVSEYTAKDLFYSDSVIATVVYADFYKAVVEITPNLCATVHNGNNYGLDKFDKVMVSLKKPKKTSKLFCTVDHVYYDEKNYRLDNWSYFCDKRKIS